MDVVFSTCNQFKDQPIQLGTFNFGIDHLICRIVLIPEFQHSNNTIVAVNSFIFNGTFLSAFFRKQLSHNEQFIFEHTKGLK